RGRRPGRRGRTGGAIGRRVASGAWHSRRSGERLSIQRGGNRGHGFFGGSAGLDGSGFSSVFFTDLGEARPGPALRPPGGGGEGGGDPGGPFRADQLRWGGGLRFAPAGRPGRGGGNRAGRVPPPDQERGDPPPPHVAAPAEAGLPVPAAPVHDRV